jgi:hypothetical protein
VISSSTRPGKPATRGLRLASRLRSGELPAGITDSVGASAGLRVRLTCMRARHLYLYLSWPRRPRPGWSRPVRIHVRSMFARMSRYAPAASGIRSVPREQAAGQNGRPRQVSVSFVTKSGRIIELSSRLLIRGFGVQVPDGTPVLTWGFTAPGHFFVSVLSPWLLRGCSCARTQQSRVCQKWPARPRMRGHARRSCADTPGRRRSGPARPVV